MNSKITSGTLIELDTKKRKSAKIKRKSSKKIKKK